MKAWIVGLENIQPYTGYPGWVLYPSNAHRITHKVGAEVVYQTERIYTEGKPPHRVWITWNDELGIYLEFVRRCEAVGFKLGDPP